MYGINDTLLKYERNDYAEHLSEFNFKIDVSLGTNPYGPWPGLNDYIIDLNHIDAYPHGDEELLEEICKHFASVTKLESDMIALSCGSIGAMLTLNRMFLKPGKTILGVAPQFTAVIDDFNMYGANYQPVYLRKEDKFKFSLEDFLADLEDLDEAYIYIDNPNNPTGQVIPKSDLEQIVAEAEKRNSFVIIDEAYGDYMDLEESSVDLLERYDNLIVVRTFSKGLGAAGIRLGYVVGKKDFISVFNKANLPFAKSSIAGEIGAKIINSGWEKECRSNVNSGKKRIIEALEDTKLRIGYTSVNVPISMVYCEDDSIDLIKVMERAGLKAVPCEGYDGLGKNYVRINLHKDMDLLIECLLKTSELIIK